MAKVPKTTLKYPVVWGTIDKENRSKGGKEHKLDSKKWTEGYISTEQRRNRGRTKTNKKIDEWM